MISIKDIIIFFNAEKIKLETSLKELKFDE